MWGVSQVRDGADVLPWTLRHLRAHGLAGVLLTDHSSHDQTVALAQAEARPGFEVLVEHDAGLEYRQVENVARMAARARVLGATWVVPFDQDELWSPEGWRRDERLAALLLSAPAAWQAVRCAVKDHHPHATDDPAQPNPWRRQRWACRGGAGKHAVRAGVAIGFGADHVGTRAVGQLGIVVRHCPVRSVAQYRLKIARGAPALRATGAANPGDYWFRDEAVVAHGDDAAVLAAVRRGRTLIHDPAPYAGEE